jgi:phosphate:Na+ symporter
MFKLLNVALDVMKKNLDNGLQGKHLEEAEEAEKAINKFRNHLKEGHLKSIEKGKYKFDSGMIYTDLFAAIESIGDRIISISEAACGKIS